MPSSPDQYTPLTDLMAMSPEQLEDRLDDFRSPRHDPDYGDNDYIDPARYWGERLGIPGLYQTYKRVFQGLNKQIEMELRGWRESDQRELLVAEVRSNYNRLVAKYPEIGEIGVTNFWEGWFVVMGCLSNFSPSDIAHFIETDRDPSVEDPNYDLRRLRIQERLGYTLEWRMGAESLALLENHFGLEPLPDPRPAPLPTSGPKP